MIFFTSLRYSSLNPKQIAWCFSTIRRCSYFVNSAFCNDFGSAFLLVSTITSKIFLAFSRGLHSVGLFRSTSAGIAIYRNWSSSIHLLLRLFFSYHSCFRTFRKKFTSSLINMQRRAIWLFVCLISRKLMVQIHSLHSFFRCLL